MKAMVTGIGLKQEVERTCLGSQNTKIGIIKNIPAIRSEVNCLSASLNAILRDLKIINRLIILIPLTLLITIYELSEKGKKTLNFYFSLRTDADSHCLDSKKVG